MDYGQIIFTSLQSDVPGTSVQSSQTLSVTPPVSCPWCAKAFGRKQELKRHILSFHLPFWICCPHPSCSWRGARTEELRKHMGKGWCGSEVQPEQYKIYEPKWILDCVFNDSHDTPVSLNLRFAETFALELVLMRAMELQKVELWGDLWGRNRREYPA